jgi:hypothetical protein
VRLTRHATATAFLDAVRPTLGTREAEHHLVLGVAEGHAVHPTPDIPFFAATVEDDDGLAVAAWMVGRRPLLLASDRVTIASAMAVLLDALDEAGHAPRRVIGAAGQAEEFTDRWSDRTGTPARLAMRQRVYRLGTVDPVTPVPGHLRVATTADLDLVAEWIAAFEHEALGPQFASPARAVAEQRIASGEVYLWCDPDPRSMAGSARPTTRGIAVNAVYTPNRWRRHGYATASVAELSARLLRRGYEFCVLYTDLANPTSNAIYARIGYRPVRDFLMYDLTGEQR